MVDPSVGTYSIRNLNCQVAIPWVADQSKRIFLNCANIYIVYVAKVHFFWELLSKVIWRQKFAHFYPTYLDNSWKSRVEYIFLVQYGCAKYLSLKRNGLYVYSTIYTRTTWCYKKAEPTFLKCDEAYFHMGYIIKIVYNPPQITK